MRNGAEQALSFVDLKDGERNFFASADLRAERANSDLLPCEIVADTYLGEVFEDALDVCDDRKASNCGAHGTHRARVSCLEVAGADIV